MVDKTDGKTIQCTTSAHHGYDFCIKHGGGKKCKHVDKADGKNIPCMTSTQNGYDFCTNHGEGKKCKHFFHVHFPLYHCSPQRLNKNRALQKSQIDRGGQIDLHTCNVVTNKILTPPYLNTLAIALAPEWQNCATAIIN